MTERGILFSAPMVRALLDGSKTQTRRIVKPQPANDPKKHHLIRPYNTSIGQWNWVLASTGHGCGDPFDCPYGQPGDRLWVRETFSDIYGAGGDEVRRKQEVMYRADGEMDPYVIGGRWTPSIQMPRWASRILLEIVSVRVELLQDISEGDARAEGITPHEVRQFAMFGASAEERAAMHRRAAINPYRDLWESINGIGSWSANPWVWVVEFKRVMP